MGLRSFLWGMSYLSRSVEGRRVHIRRRLAAGTLPPTDGRTYLSRARGRHRCACCRLLILPPGTQCDVLETVQLYAHKSCFKIWVAESQRAADGRADAPHAARGRAPSRVRHAI